MIVLRLKSCRTYISDDSYLSKVNEKRTLRTILFADIAGYTAFMQADEARALGFLKSFKSTISDRAGAFQGEIVQYYGDGCLMAFESTVRTVEFATGIQQTFIEAGVPVRIGIHVGDVIYREGNVFGDGVNLASRIESLGVPGSVLLSRAVRDQVKNQPGVELQSVGMHDFKNVEEPMEVFAVANDPFIVPHTSEMQGKVKLPEGKKKSVSRRYAIPIAILLLLVVGALWKVSQRVSDFEENEVVRLAVMEFADQGVPLDESFSTVLAEELTNRLSGLRNLSVIARTSSAVFSKEGKSTREIGEELDVDYVLQGALKWGRDASGVATLTVTPRLERVSTNSMIWARPFDRALDNVADAHIGITNEVLRNLDVVLSAEEQKNVQDRYTDNKLAFDTYLKALHATPAGHARRSEYQRADRLVKQALALDPELAQAWLLMSEVYAGYYWFGIDVRPSMLDSALVCIERARKLRPEMPEVTLATGQYYYQLRNYSRAMQEYSVVINDRPNDPEALYYMGALWRRQGFFDQAVETFERAVSLDPFNVQYLIELSWTYLFTGNLDRAFELREQSLKYNPDEEWNHLCGALIHWTRGEPGDLVDARSLLENVPNPKSEYPAYFWSLQMSFEEDYEGINNMLDNLSTEVLEMQEKYFPVARVRGLAYYHMGKNEEAQEQLLESEKILLAELEEVPTDFRLHTALSVTYAAMGEREKAVSKAQDAQAILPLEVDALLGQDILYDSMRAYALLGDVDGALAIMKKMFSKPCQYGGFMFSANPDFGVLHDHPQFLAQLEMQRKAHEKFND